MSDIDERRRITYEFPDPGTMVFIPACPACGRFVKADPTIGLRIVGISEAGPSIEPREPNATCQRDGRVAMIWDSRAIPNG